ncbi:MAG: dTMP kinase [Thermoplasmata archaeon]|nr:dTMP kinase [Thermoplasmata archaeon]
MTPSARGALVAIEGIDGTGKTTLQHALAVHWRGRGLRVLELREPSRGPAGQRARHASRRDPWTAAMAFTEDRWRQRSRIDRALRRGTVVLLDRSFYSTLAYQGSALPVALRQVLEHLQRAVTVVPHRVVLLDVPLTTSWARMERRGGRRDPTERREVLRRAARAYRSMAREPGWIVLDARRSPDELVAQLDRRLTPWVLRRRGRSRGRA